MGGYLTLLSTYRDGQSDRVSSLPAGTVTYPDQLEMSDGSYSPGEPARHGRGVLPVRLSLSALTCRPSVVSARESALLGPVGDVLLGTWARVPGDPGLLFPDLGRLSGLAHRATLRHPAPPHEWDVDGGPCSPSDGPDEGVRLLGPRAPPGAGAGVPLCPRRRQEMGFVFSFKGLL